MDSFAKSKMRNSEKMAVIPSSESGVVQLTCAKGCKGEITGRSPFLINAMRTGVTHWQAGEIEVSHGMICKAYSILNVTHGPTHPITKDLEAMRMQTEMELRMFKQNEYVYHSMREAALKNKPMAMMHEPKSVEEGIKNLFHRKK